MREASEETPIVRRFTSEVGISFFDKQDSLCRPRSALHLDPATAITLRKRARPQANLFCPRAELGTSRTMLHTSLSAKKSSPVNCRLFFAPSTSQKKGSLRQPAKKRVSPASVTLASRPIETGAPSTITRPPSPVPAACGHQRGGESQFVRRARKLRSAPGKRYRPRITIGVNLELVQCFGCERLGRGRPWRVFAGRRMHVHNQDGFPGVSRFRKAYRSVKSSRASPWGKLKSGPE